MHVQGVPAAGAFEAAALAPPAGELREEYTGTSVRTLLRELRSQSQSLQRATWELEATQKLLRQAQQEAIGKAAQVEELRRAKPNYFAYLVRRQPARYAPGHWP